MKKILVFLSILVFIFVIPIKASAYELESEGDEAQFGIEIQLTGVYIVSIPDEIRLDLQKVPKETISVDVSRLGEGESLSIIVKSKNGWKLISGTTVINYYITDVENDKTKNYKDDFEMTIIDKWDGKQNSVSKPIYFYYGSDESSIVNPGNNPSGKYEDTLTFYVNVE